MTNHDLIPVTITSAFVVGMLLGLLGSIKLPLAKRLAIDESRVGGLLSALNLALIPMMVLSGLCVDRFGVRGMLVLGSLLTGLALVALTLSQSYRRCLLAILLAGAGTACLSTSAITLMPVAFFDANAAASLNLGNVFFGFGALTMPVLVDLLVRRLDLRRALGVVAAACLVPALAALLTSGHNFPSASQESALAVLSQSTLWLTGVVFLLYGPLEGALVTWATTYLTELGYRERVANWMLAGFWLAFLGGRLLTSYLQQRYILPEGSELWYILALGLAAAVVFGNLAGTQRGSLAGWGLLALGAILGPIFPTLVGFLFNQSFVGSERGTAYGAMFAIGATGSLVVAPIIGRFARQRSVREALRIPAFGSLLLAGAALVLALLLI